MPITAFTDVYHKGKLQPILSEDGIEEYLISSGGEIDKKIEEFLKNGSNWNLIRIDMIFIEVYTYC